MVSRETERLGKKREVPNKKRKAELGVIVGGEGKTGGYQANGRAFEGWCGGRKFRKETANKGLYLRSSRATKHESR